MTLAEDVTAIQSRLADAERTRARAEGQRDAAQSALDNARDELKRDFGVDSAEAAERLLTELRAELVDIVALISAKLDEIGV